MSAVTGLRALIVEDEPLAAELLATMLTRHADVVQTAVATDASSALALCRLLAPNVAFVDIQLAGHDGFRLLRQLGESMPRTIAIVTAHSRHAVEAFDIAAVDFLLKPFDEQRLALTLERMRQRLANGNEGTGGPCAPPENDYVRRLAAWQPGDQRARLVPVERILWIEGDGRSVRCHTPDGTFRARVAIGELEAVLDPRLFARINRSAIVQVARVTEIQRWSRGNYLVVLSNGEHLRSSTSHRPAVAKILAGR